MRARLGVHAAEGQLRVVVREDHLLLLFLCVFVLCWFQKGEGEDDV